MERQVTETLRNMTLVKRLGDGFWEESDESGLDLHHFDDLDELLSLEEMEEELEDLIGPAHDLEMWKLRKLCFR